MTPATDRDHLLRAICDPANFADDALRLAFSDELEAAGDAARAEFVRTQIELAEGPRSFRVCWENQAKIDAEARRMDRLRRRERELFNSPLGFRLRDELPFLRHTINPETMTDDAPPGVVRAFPAGLYRRGWIAAVRCTLADWLAHGKAIARLHPVERVETEKEPGRVHTLMTPASSDHWCWFNEDVADGVGGPSRLPGEIATLLEPSTGRAYRYDYPSRDDAVSALSAALLAWARQP